MTIDWYCSQSVTYSSVVFRPRRNKSTTFSLTLHVSLTTTCVAVAGSCTVPGTNSLQLKIWAWHDAGNAGGFDVVHELLNDFSIVCFVACSVRIEKQNVDRGRNCVATL
jgi:hypothetical protein